MEILVVGGSGFVGTNFIQYILDKYNDYKVINVDKSNSQTEEHANYRFYQIDICNFEELLKLFKFWYSFDIVINLSNSTDCLSNITGLYNLLEITKKYKAKKFLQISTNEVYETSKNDSYDDHYSFIEEDIIKPKSFQLASRASCDLIALSYYYSFNSPIIVSRSSELYGPYQEIEDFIPSTIIKLIANNQICINPLICKNWLNVLDYCRALDSLMHYGVAGQIYNVCGNKILKNFNVAKLIIDIMKKDENLLEEIQDEQINTPFLDCTKITELLRWKPLIQIKEGLEDTISWFEDNKQKS
jgi:dTDP-glucose 4,6-dehydratase